MSTALALPSVGDAHLPAAYEHAKEALAQCDRVDECKDWADKAAALASYAKQADDSTLHTLAVRIQARAIRRAGELLQEFQQPGARTDKPSAVTDTRLTQRDAAEHAGMSKRQEVTAVRVANVPAVEFEAAIEAERPPTITALAARGTDKRPTPMSAAGFAEATTLIGLMRSLAQFCDAHEPGAVVIGLRASEPQRIRRDMETVAAWMNTFVTVMVEGTDGV